jgi:hypothetical protein
LRAKCQKSSAAAAAARRLNELRLLNGKQSGDALFVICFISRVDHHELVGISQAGKEHTHRPREQWRGIPLLG